MDPVTLILIVVVLLLLFGGGGSYVYTRRPGYTGWVAPDVLYIVLMLVVVIVLLKLIGVI
jgi:hypothetical protein